MKRNTKKGFTIVELIIVIAVIAVLAAVLIPTFSNLIQKANVAADTTLIKNLNTALAMDTSVSKHVTMTQALEATKENGFDVEKIVARATDNKIVWDSVNDCFAYSEKDKTGLTYIPDSKTDANVEAYQLWTIVKGNNVDDIYSSYIAGTNVTGTIDATKGVDVGENTGINEINYTGSTDPQSVVIRTNGGKLTVEASKDHVEHYGLAREIDVKAVSETTYVEHGTVAKMTVAAEAKNVVIKTTAVVVQLNNGSKNVSVEGNGYVGELKGSEKLQTGTVGGDTIQVGTYDKLQALALASTLNISLNGKTIELTADIDLTGKVWTPFGFSEQAPFDGIIDGKGHAIKGLSSAGYTHDKNAWITNETNKNTGPAYGFVCIAQNATIKNIRFVDVNMDVENGIAVGAVVGDARGTSLTIDNVTVNGTVKAMDKVGGFVGLAGYNGSSNFGLTIKNSTNNANVIAECSISEKYNRAGGFVGGLGGDTNYKQVTFENCTNNGNVTVTGNKEKESNQSNAGLRVMAGGFIGSVNGAGKTMSATNCTNTGTITATNTKTNVTKIVTGMGDGVKDNDGWLQVYSIYAE